MSEVREVQIRRRETKNHLPAPVISESKKYLASIYSGQGPLRGLSGEEEKEILSSYLGIDREDKDLTRIIRDFWADLRVEIPMEGKALNITTDEKGTPYEPYDYVIYQFAKKHPHVGADEEDMLNDSKKMFYIYDPEVAVSKTNEKVAFKKKAYAELIKIGEDQDKLDRLIRLLTESEPENMSLKLKQNYLDQVIEDNPKRFFIVATDKNLETKAILSEMVSHGVINKIGNQYYFIDEKLGDDVDEAVLFFNDKKRSEQVTRMKAKLQEAKKIA